MLRDVAAGGLPAGTAHREATMSESKLIRDTREKMKKGVDFFEDGLRGLRTGRPTPALVENIRVEAYGNPMPLNQVASISVPDPRTLVVKPFDPSMCPAIEKAILKSDIGITPASDGKVVRLAVPMMSQEQRDKMTHRVKDLAEQARVVVRNIRRDQNKAAELAMKAAQIGEDEEKAAKDGIQKLTKEMEAEIDRIVEQRTKEIQSA
jgi:ribosome recycling factor